MRSTRITPSTVPLERAFLVGITLPRARREDEIQNLAELELLARSAGAEVVGRTLQSRTRVDGTTFVGKIGRDQILDYHRRKQMDLPAVERWLGPYLNYDPGAAT